MLKKFFLPSYKFNIYLIIGLLIILSNLYFGNPLLVFTGLVITLIPEVYTSILDYRENGNINIKLTSIGIIFIVFSVILLINYLLN